MSLGSRARRNFTLRLLCPFWVNVRTANQFNDMPRRAKGQRPRLAFFARIGAGVCDGATLLQASSGMICSTSRTMARRNFGSGMLMNAFTKAKPSDVARKSFTYKSESAISTVAPDWPGALSKKIRNRHLQDL